MKKKPTKSKRKASMRQKAKGCRRPSACSGVISRSDALDAIPKNWLDSLLTGPQKALEGQPGTWNCADIERLLLAIRARINRLPNDPNSHTA